MACEAKENPGCQEETITSCNEDAGPDAATTGLDELEPEIVDRKVTLLVAAGSAMATGCEPCMDQIIPNLIEAGVGESDIRRAVEIGQRVKDAAADYMKEVADVLAGTHLARSSTPDPVITDPTPEGSGCCG